MKIIKQKNCLLCKSTTKKTVLDYKKPDIYEEAVGVGSKGYWRKWVTCQNCGLHYSIYSRPEKIIDRIYQSAYRDKNASWRKETPEEIFSRITTLPEKESETKLRVRWIKENIRKLWEQDLVRKNNPPYKVLDVGGGAAVFAYEFQDKEWSSSIIDPSASNSFVKTKLNMPLVQDFYSSGRFPSTFNLVSLIYVLEHVANPIRFLKSVREDMAKDSFLYVEIPDALAFRFKPKEDDIFNSCHLWMFDPSTLTALLHMCGFEIFNLARIKTLRGHYALTVIAGQKPSKK